MKKMIKKSVQLRLDELIKYARDNQLNKIFTSDKGLKKIAITKSSIDFRSLDNGIISSHDTFTVEVEEEINNTTIFKSVVGVLNNDEIMLTNMHTTIEGIQDKYGPMKEIHAVIDGKLELIYERKEESINA